MNPDATLVAVYGSLRHGLANHRMLVREGAVSVTRPDGKPLFIKGYDLYSVGPYPGVKVSITNPEAAVTVEVYSVSEAALQTLDYFEGHPHHYRRESVVVLNGADGEMLRAQAYLYQLDPDRRLPLVTSGDWMTHLAARQGQGGRDPI